MKKTYIRSIVACVLLCWPAVGFGQTQTPQQFLTKPDPTSEYVKYEGTLICFRCDVSAKPESRARCKREGHAALLKREGERTQKLYGSKHSITEKLGSEEFDVRDKAKEALLRLGGAAFPMLEKAAQNNQPADGFNH